MPTNEWSRREFIGGVSITPALALAGQRDRAMIKPPALRPGATIGLVAPASPVFEPSEIREGKAALEALGFRVKVAEHIGRKWGYLAGSDQERSEDVMNMFLDPEVSAIVALRGGYGALRILPYLDYEAIRRNPKILLGYSDVTSLHLAIHKLAGIVTFHGPVALSTFNEYSTRYFRKTLMQTQAVGVIEEPAAGLPALQTFGKKSGRVQGALVGGNMTLVCAGLGTPYEIETQDRVLFLEEVGEEPYALDRMLTQLDQAGKLRSCRAILLDRCAKCGPADYKPAFQNTLSVEEIISDRLGQLDIPVLFGLSLGHVADKPVLPLGVQVAVDADQRRYEILEPAVS
ncbi:MAG: putative murein peptide carboxypeptidase [bacterium ADurb.Bin478]|nr:MAG: putative murein peptide carboxypeptidase [bacterium ADurb.Bin478]